MASRFRFTLSHLLIATAIVACLSTLPHTYGCNSSGGLGQPWKSASTIAFAPDGESLAVEAYDGVAVNRDMKFYDVDMIQSVFLLHTAGDSKPVRIDRQYIGQCQGEEWASTRIAFSPSGAELLIATRDGKLFLRNLDRAQTTELADVVGVGRLQSIAWSADTLVAGGGGLAVVDPTSGVAKPIDAHARHLSLSLDGQHALIAGFGRIQLWRLRTPPLLLHSFVVNDIRAIALSPDGKLAAVGSNEGVLLWNLTTDEVDRIDVGEEPFTYAVAFSPDSQQLALGGVQGVALVDIASKPWRAAPLGDRAATCVAFSPDGKRLASGHLSARITMWDVPSRRPVWNAKLPGKTRFSILVPLTGVLILCAYLWMERRLRHRTERPTKGET